MYSLAEGVVHPSLTFIVILLLLFLNDNLKVHSIHFLYIKKKNPKYKIVIKNRYKDRENKRMKINTLQSRKGH